MSRGKAGGRFGIVDLGSNSVRLVVYAGVERNPVLVFNEKVMAGLGRSLASTGRLDPKGIERALDALRRVEESCPGAGAKIRRKVPAYR